MRAARLNTSSSSGGSQPGSPAISSHSGASTTDEETAINRPEESKIQAVGMGVSKKIQSNLFALKIISKHKIL